MEEQQITYHAVEKDGMVTAIWEMNGRKHIRTIDPRSEEGRRILGSHTIDEATEHGQAQQQTEEQSPPQAEAQAAQQGES